MGVIIRAVVLFHAFFFFQYIDDERDILTVRGEPVEPYELI